MAEKAALHTLQLTISHLLAWTWLRALVLDYSVIELLDHCSPVLTGESVDLMASMLVICE